VGITHDKHVFDDKTDVFLKYYSPECHHCQDMKEAWKSLAEAVKDVPNLLIAEYDQSANENENAGADYLPTMRFFRSGAKDMPQDYNKARTVEGWIEFLKAHSPAYRAYLESKGEKVEGDLADLEAKEEPYMYEGEEEGHAHTEEL